MQSKLKKVALLNRISGIDCGSNPPRRVYERLAQIEQGPHVKRSMILQRRSQYLLRCLFGTVAMPRRSPDRPEAGRAYQVDKGAGAIPNAKVSLAMDVSGAPSGNRSNAANPA